MKYVFVLLSMKVLLLPLYSTVVVYCLQDCLLHDGLTDAYNDVHMVRLLSIHTQ